MLTVAAAGERLGVSESTVLPRASTVGEVRPNTCFNFNLREIPPSRS